MRALFNALHSWRKLFPAPVSTAMKTLSCLAKRMINLGKNYETEYGSVGEIETAKQQSQQTGKRHTRLLAKRGLKLKLKLILFMDGK